MESIQIKGITYKLPMYLPDATRGVVKGLSSEDLTKLNTRGVVVNTLHLSKTPGSEILKSFGGIKPFMNFEGLITSDSGGWQIFSLIHRSSRPGKIVDEGVVFYPGRNRKELFTPEESIRMQFDINSDIIVCLDDFTSPDYSDKEIAKSVERTTNWAKRSKDEYQRQINERRIESKDRPLILSVVQGHTSKEYRSLSIEGLTNIDFDGYGFGGYAIDANGNLDLEISEYISKHLPDNRFKFALGTGKPQDILAQRKFGWDFFDCTLPTRDARHGKFYISENTSLMIDKSIYKNDTNPVDDKCMCETCRNHSKAYLHHLFKIKDLTFNRLATIHNLFYYNHLLETIN